MLTVHAVPDLRVALGRFSGRFVIGGRFEWLS